MVVVAAIAFVAFAARATSTVAAPPREPSPVPVLAYYYIWFDVNSWDRAKTDYPQLGRYSSDDVDVMRQHIQWAKQAGIDGFIVSWKSQDRLNARLEKLIRVAESEEFRLVIIYQGLDFYRQPLPVQQVYADIGYFVQRFASSPVFELFEKPMVIWSGTWEFSREEIAQVSQAYRNQILLLATEKNVPGYRRIANLVDGDAYYWSSVNPATNAGYADKMNAMSQVVHEHNGLWIAPAAPGFDARLVGGTSVVERKNGETLRQQMNVAIDSSPDLIGIISWNEFSENTHIEPSENYGDLYLKVLTDIQTAPIPEIANFDSSEPAATSTWMGLDRITAMGIIAVMTLASLSVILRRQLAKH